MDKVYRRGVAIDVALRAAVKRNTTQGAPAQQPSALSMQAQGHAPAPPGAAAPAAPSGLRSRVKRALRGSVKLAWRVVRPFVRPVVFRTRRYFSFELQQQLQQQHAATAQAIERMSADLMREIQVSRELLRNELASTQQHTGEQLMRRMEQMDLNTQGSIARVAFAHQGTYDALQALHGESVAQKAGVGQHLKMLHELSNTIAYQMDRIPEVSVEVNHKLALLQESTAAVTRQFDVLLGDVAAVARQVEALHSASAAVGIDVQGLAQGLPPRLDRIEQYGHAAARRVIIPCGLDEVLLKTEAGYVMCPVSDRSIMACLADTGDLERGTRLLIQRALRPGDVFVDVGANLGIHTLAAARALQGRGKIIAFEPFETTRRMLEETVRINGYASMTEIHQAAVSNTAGRQSLYLGKSSGHHSLYALDALDAGGGAAVDVITVRLDDVIAAGQPVNMIKIDAEGAELAVLDSAAATIGANPGIALIVEFGPSHLVRNGQSARDWLARFAALGLEHRAIDPASGVLERWDLARLEAVDSINLLFARPDAPVWALLGAA